MTTETTSAIDLVVNGEPRAVPPGTTVSALLAAHGIEPAHVAVERNGAILPREAFATVLANGDRLEIVHFVGGG